MSVKAASHKKAILVTGASTGIGRAIALRLGQLGFRVFAGVRREEDALMLLKDASIRLTPVYLDVTNADQIMQVRDQIANSLQEEDARLIGLVNNAGVVVGGPLEFLPVDDLRRQFEINVFGVISVTQAFLPLLRKNPAGIPRIVNMSSIAGRSTLPFVGPYSASKHALEALSDALRVELSTWGIHVSLIEPGAIATPIWDKGMIDGEARTGKFPPEAFTFYEKTMYKIRDYSQQASTGAAPVSTVVEPVLDALFSTSPRTRYLVGKDARLRALMNLLPDKTQDALIRWKLKI